MNYCCLSIHVHYSTVVLYIMHNPVFLFSCFETIMQHHTIVMFAHACFNIYTTTIVK